MVIQLPDDGEAKELVMTINTFLAILVAVLLNGCYAFTGQCMNGGYGPQCTADGSTYDADASGGSDSKVSESDANSSPETAVEIDTGPTVEEICKDYMFLKDTKWVCHYGFDKEGTLGVAVDDNHTTCLVYSSSQWQVKAESLVFHTPDQLVYDNVKYGVPPASGGEPKTCDKVK